jgi:hypothetical protein
MIEADYKRLKRRRWLERFLHKKLWLTKKQAMRITGLIF